MWLHRLDDADASCGGKAVGLARLLGAGLPVPDGFVIDDRAFRHLVGEIDVTAGLDARPHPIGFLPHASSGAEPGSSLGHQLVEAAHRIATGELPTDLVREVEERAAALGVLAVRSSATIEDGDAGSGAGVFSSSTAVPARDVWAAIRAVWGSALTPLAAAYARRRGGTISIGVIIQRFVPGELVTIYTRPPGEPSRDELLIQRGETTTRGVRPATDAITALALQAEAAIGSPRGADVEIVEAAATRWIVQARPIVHPVTRPRRPPPPSVIAPLVADGRTWTWDVAHNPDPLSSAQAGLVEHVDRAEVSAWSLKVCAGFLYAARREDPAAQHVVATPHNVAALDARVHELELAMEAALTGPAPTRGILDDAIARYLAFYRIWSTELAPLIAAARMNLAPAQLAGARPSSVESTLFAAARGELDEPTLLARIGVLSPAWDVSTATFGERPELVRDAIERARAVIEAPHPITTSAAPGAGPAPLETLHHHARAAADHADRDLARAAADLAERDDIWFARAQLLVRTAILARARDLAIDPEDAFWIPLDELAAATALDPDDVRRRASAARTAAARAAQWSMPIVVGGDSLPAEAPLRGVGTGPRVTGRVVRFASLASAVMVGAGDVVVARAVTPALAVLVIGCAALVSETGGLLDHGAALARELGIPCVVGCRDAWSLLADGMLVTVDGEAGEVAVSPTDN